MKTRILHVLFTFIACIVFSHNSIAAQTYPDRAIRLIVPFAPGGGTDFVARTLAKNLTQQLGQTVVVENHGGARTFIGALMVAKAPPDGYTLLLSSASTFAINPNIPPKAPYDPLKDFSPVALVARLPLFLVTAPSFPAKDMAGFLRHVKSLPVNRSIQYGSPGIGSTHQLAMEMLAQRAGFRAAHVPYKGAAPAMQGLLDGSISTMFLDLATGQEQIKAGKLHALAISSSTRSPLMPNVPTLAESGVPNYDAAAWIGIVAPAHTPSPVVDRLNREINRALADPIIRKRFAAAGAETVTSTPESFGTYMASEMKSWSEVIRKAHLSK
ncbi:tripartite tricarboxylate transporter substrate binding protein [Candidimonas nitroreducens]|uniref:ABC transporter substrate-binding protein n=1 Tax=Candidimonas nitroreducens TaxID=683354 RepID=A0A225MRI5_9BURK|nr:tripartite tricarboxylate transporter substrate binding protein [Candidimonas nitroreducens]OWT63825.1 hypothetical protein CEY11_05830 [Candidimonas nitroreducens]